MNIILDTSLLLLYLVGRYDTDFIRIFNRTSKYSKEDFNEVRKVIESAKSVYITPQIVAEVSNLSKKMDDERSSRFKDYMIVLIRELKKYKEEYIKLENLLKNEVLLIKVGFTDTSILELAINMQSKKMNYLILTDDWPLSQRALSLGYQALNFTNLRGYKWFKD